MYAPIMINGRTLLVDLPQGDDPQADFQRREDEVHTLQVARRRVYYDGAQFDKVPAYMAEATAATTTSCSRPRCAGSR